MDIAEYTIFYTPVGWRYAIGTGNVLTGIAGEEKVLEIALWGASGFRVNWSAVTNIIVSDAPIEVVLQDARNCKKAEIAAYRYELETAGINGIKTDRESQALITGAALQALVDPDYVCKWKTEAGFIDLNATQIKAIAQLVREHVQNCFDKEARLTELIDASMSLEELNNISWEMELE
jgi:hypothetical protein